MKVTKNIKCKLCSLTQTLTDMYNETGLCDSCLNKIKNIQDK